MNAPIVDHSLNPIGEVPGRPTAAMRSRDDRLALLNRIGVASEVERKAQRSYLIPLMAAVIGALLLIVGYLILSGRAPSVADAGSTAAAPADAAKSAKPGAAAPASLVAQGYIVARRQATVSSRQLGVIEAIYVDEGDYVERGQILGRLDRRDANLALRAVEAEYGIARSATRSAHAQLGQQRSDLKRRSALYDRGFLSKADMEVAETRSEVVQADLASALAREQSARELIARSQLQIDDLSIRAPFSGIVTERNAQPGEVLAPTGAGGGFTRTGLCTIVDMASRQIVVDVSEQMITRVRQGQRVEAQLSAYPDLKVLGRVAQITPSADRGRGTVRVRIDLLTEDLRILPDMAVKVRFL